MITLLLKAELVSLMSFLHSFDNINIELLNSLSTHGYGLDESRIIVKF